ncbi:alpha/beta fold hydrolase [Erwinia sp. CPCC 100877]|nr:alpha/beta fold hydrolase [Erwinia sp. CPCC 100877]
MEHRTFLSADQQTTGHFVCWNAVTEPVAVIQIIHGMAEYIERYHEFATYLNELGYIVVGHDHLGHGAALSQVQGAHGFFCDEEPVQTVLADIHQVKGWIDKIYPELPHFMLGHSMGSFALRNYLQIYRPKINGAIFMGAGTKPTLLSLGLSLTNYLNKRAPKRINQWLDRLTFGSYSKHFPEAGRFNWLSKNQENVHKYEEDSLTGFTFTNNGFYTLFRLVAGANRQGWAEKVAKDLPVLVISGGQDPVGDFGKGPKKVANELTEAGVADVTLVLFEELRHELLFEKEAGEVYKAFSRWLEKRVES